MDYYVILAGDLKLLTESDRKEFSDAISDVKAVVTGFLKTVIAAIEEEQKRQTVNGSR